MKKYALAAVALIVAQGLEAKHLKFENEYIALQSQFGLCGYFTLEPLFNLGQHEIQLTAEQWKQDQFVKKSLGTTIYKPGHVYNFGSGKAYRVYCSIKGPVGYQADFSSGNGVQFVPDTNSNTGSSVNVSVTIAGGAQNYEFKRVSCDKLFKFGKRTSMERSCLSPLAPENPGTVEIGMKD